jgi:hypothetical protein
MFISPITSQNNGFLPACRALSPLQQQTMDLQVFYHHIYEYKKGLRNLVLTTEKQEHRSHIEDRLQGNKIDYVIQDVNPQTMNVFFGAKDCVEVVKTFIDKRLNKLSPEQDFILGIMLGYDRLKQCSRYLDFKNKNSK